ncbi:MAG TPA: RES family NAD+ phosphorylase [Silvibacterium sp.]|nr:RES family NAD+ phosphorylase [Silvibacterium sp.]
MLLWRISRHRDLKGTGALRAAARWHHAGRPIVYLAETPAAALLEVCVHTTANDVPPEFTLLKIEGPDFPEADLTDPDLPDTDLPENKDKVASIRLEDLPKNWRTRPEITRDLGTAWLEKNETVLLRVPSALVPETTNCLFNPAHRRAAKFRVVEAIKYPFDPRIKQ